MAKLVLSNKNTVGASRRSFLFYTNNMKKLLKFNKYALGINLVIILFEIIGIIMRAIMSTRTWFDYYTVDSNLFALATSAIFVYFTLKGKELPHWAQVAKLSSTTALMVTFLVVITVLGPIYPGGYPAILFEGQMLFTHTLCPPLAFFSFIFLERTKLSGKDVAPAMIFTLVYAAIMIILNIAKVVVGPYPFLMVYNQPIWASVAWCIGILGGAAALTWGIIKLRRHK
jgi:hypothetical protein